MRWGKGGARGQKAHGKAMQEKEQEQESVRMHERMDTTAEQLWEKDKHAVKCQGYLIHQEAMIMALY